MVYGRRWKIEYASLAEKKKAAIWRYISIIIDLSVAYGQYIFQKNSNYQCRSQNNCSGRCYCPAQRRRCIWRGLKRNR